MSYTNTISSSVMEQWIAEKLDITAIKEKLQSMGIDEESRAKYIADFKKLKNGRRQFRGFLMTGIGSFLGFVSCVLTMTNAVPAMNDFFLYGLTSIAVIIAFWGMYLIFEE